MAVQLFANNAGAMLAASITDADVSLQVAGGFGALFPSPSGGDWFMVTLMDVDGNREVVKCTARSTDVFTIVRAQEGTSARAWTGNAARVELRVTKGTLEQFIQQSGLLTGDLDADGNEIQNVVLPSPTISGEVGVEGDGELVTTQPVRVNRALPAYRLYETDAPVDEKAWSWQCEAGDLILRARNDSFASGSSPVAIRRTGTVIDEIELNATLFDLNGNADLSGDLDVVGDVDITGGLTVGGVELPSSGTYTPTYVTGTNIDGIVALGESMYTRIGDIVHVSGYASVNPTATGASEFFISLPIASNLADLYDCSGHLTGNTHDDGYIFADITNNRAEVNFSAVNGSTSVMAWSFTYIVI